MINLFKHTSRAYFDIYNALVAAYPRKPTWLFKEMAGLFDFSSELLNRVATDILYPQTRESAYAFANLCDYTVSEADGATDSVTFTLTGAMAKTISAGYQVGGKSASTGKLVIYEVTADAASGGGSSIVASVKQKKTITDKLIFEIDNSDDFADYPIDGYTNIIGSTFELEIDSVAWTKVDNFDDSEDDDKHFVLIRQSGGKVRVGFGDGTTGQKPTIGQAVYATFEITEGLSGRMEAGEITINIGGDADIQSLTNAGSSGGSDDETVSAIIRNARASVRLRNIVWSQDDLETAARAASTSVAKALGVPGIGEAEIIIIPTGGGAPGAGLKTTVDNYVTALTQFGVMPITVSDPTYQAQNITATFTTRSGFVQATVQDLLEFAMTLITSAFDIQVIDSFNDNGIDTCRTAVINVLWAWAFTSDENDALEAIIEQWIDLLGTQEYREFGDPLEVGHIWIMGDSLYDYGVDVFTLSSPLTNQTVASDEIVSTGVITMTPV